MTDLEAMLMSQEGTGPMADGHFFPYPDSLHKITIGYGHNLDDKGIPADIALMLFRSDIADALDDVRHVCSCYDQLSRPRQLVMVSLAFNLGRAKLGRFVRFLAAVHLGHHEDAADELLDSKGAREDAPARYKQLAMMWRTNTSAWV